MKMFSFWIAWARKLSIAVATTFRINGLVVAMLLAVQASLLGYSATRHSPTHLEPAFLASGICHWQAGRFEPYRVNPPLVRMVAAIPVIMAGYKLEPSTFYDNPGIRIEYILGESFMSENGQRSIWLIIYARWACIPFSLVGAYFAYRWSRELYRSAAAGITTLTLYVFEPNLLAHGELVTPDAACSAFGIVAGYTFWRWLKAPTWPRAIAAGVALGLAELTKMSWLFLFIVWPALWLLWPLMRAKRIKAAGCCQVFESYYTVQQLMQISAIICAALMTINALYNYDGVGTQLRTFRFVSKIFTGLDEAGLPGNRFRECALGYLPVPLPKQYLLGLDAQIKDFEHYPQESYLRGHSRHGGWWYYYVYGILVKVPCGTLLLLIAVVVLRIFRRSPAALVRHESVIVLPAIILLFVVSSQMEFNIHFRYVFPSIAFGLVFLGQVSKSLGSQVRAIWVCLTSAMLLWTVVDVIYVYPGHLAYFNLIAGGKECGHKHLLGSSVDWGQDLLQAIEFLKRNPDAAMFSPTVYDYGTLLDGSRKVRHPSADECKYLLLSPECWVKKDLTGMYSSCSGYVSTEWLKTVLKSETVVVQGRVGVYFVIRL